MSKDKNKWKRAFWASIIVLFLYFSYENYFGAGVAEILFPAKPKFLPAEIAESSYILLENKTLEYLDNKFHSSTSVCSHQRRSRIERSLRYLFRDSDERNWQNSLMLLGLITTNSEPNIHRVERFLNMVIDKDGNLKLKLDHIDQCSIGNIFVELYYKSGNQKYLKACSQLIKYVISSHVKSETGTIPYRQTNRNLMLIDTLWISPFLIKYGVISQNKELIDLGAFQLKEFMDFGFDNNSGLPYHAYDAVTKNQFGLIGWTRGLGWLLISLSESLKMLPVDHPDYGCLQEHFQKLIRTASSYQTHNRCFGWSINNSYSHIDSSGTAMIGYAIEVGLENHLLSDIFSVVSENALRAVLSSTTIKGAVENALAECLDVGSYPAVFGAYNYSQGMALAHYSKFIQRLNIRSSGQQEKEFPANESQ